MRRSLVRARLVVRWCVLLLTEKRFAVVKRIWMCVRASQSKKGVLYVLLILQLWRSGRMQISFEACVCW